MGVIQRKIGYNNRKKCIIGIINKIIDRFLVKKEKGMNITKVHVYITLYHVSWTFPHVI